MTPRSAPARVLAGSPFPPPPPIIPATTRFAVGDRVTHDRFGLGRVISFVDVVDVVVDFTQIEANVTVPHMKLTKL
jgi:hypothetical protein